MKTIDLLIQEFEHEARTTRRHLERLPEDKLGWRPHAKSFTAGDLASHIVDCVAWADSIFTRDELDSDPASYKPYRAASVPELLRTYDDRVASASRALAGVPETDVMQPWRFKMMGRLRFEKPRAEVFRDFTLSHLIHHRGQLSVYLRLLDVAVPGSYGPTADERS
jgi:uncharacterized damage-inducible protein DinB